MIVKNRKLNLDLRNTKGLITYVKICINILNIFLKANEMKFALNILIEKIIFVEIYQKDSDS